MSTPLAHAVPLVPIPHPPPPPALRPPPLPASPAHLHVETRPAGAIVSVQGTDRGATPLDLDVPAGELDIGVHLAGYFTEQSHVTLRPGEGTQLVVPLRRAPVSHVVRPPPPPAATGLLTISTTPWSDVYLGARHLGTTPLANVSLPAGRNVLTLRAPGRPNRTITVTVAAGTTTRVRETL